MAKILRHINLIIFSLLLAGFTSCSDEEGLGNFQPQTPEFSFDQDVINISKDGGNIIVNVTSNLPWRVKTDADWITFESENGMGNGSFEFVATKNRTVNIREASISLWITEDAQKTIKVIQAASEASDLVNHYYVKASGSEDNDGLSWEQPTTLDKALDEMMEGDYIHIAAGTYAPTKTLTGGSASNAGDITFEIHSNVNIIGGYPADATEGAISDPEANPTILTGIHASGRSFHTVAISAPIVKDKKVSIKGIQIKNGQASASGTGNISINGVPFYRFYGGGLISGKSIVEIIDCEISDNESGLHAGGVYIAGGGTVFFENTVVKNNTATTNSSNCGGVFIDASTVYFNNCAVINNACTGVGAGIYSFNSTQPTYTYIYNTTVANNNNDANAANQTRRGGGFYGRENSVTVIVNSTFYGNTGGSGAGICLYGATGKNAKLDIISSTIASNNAYNNGGGVEVANAFATLNIYNSIISGNTANVSGSDLLGAAGVFNTINATKVYDAEGNEISGLTFDAATMLGALTNNGAKGETCQLLGGDSNPATTKGMNSADLQTLGTGYTPAIDADIITKDQNGKSRTGKTSIGAVVVN